MTYRLRQPGEPHRPLDDPRPTSPPEWPEETGCELHPRAKLDGEVCPVCSAMEVLAHDGAACLDAIYFIESDLERLCASVNGASMRLLDLADRHPERIIQWWADHMLPHLRRTDAIRRCQWCRKRVGVDSLMGERKLTGDDATPGQPWHYTDGLCDECDRVQEAEHRALVGEK